MFNEFGLFPREVSDIVPFVKSAYIWPNNHINWGTSSLLDLAEVYIVQLFVVEGGRGWKKPCPPPTEREVRWNMRIEDHFCRQKLLMLSPRKMGTNWIGIQKVRMYKIYGCAGVDSEIWRNWESVSKCHRLKLFLTLCSKLAEYPYLKLNLATFQNNVYTLGGDAFNH